MSSTGEDDELHPDSRTCRMQLLAAGRWLAVLGSVRAAAATADPAAAFAMLRYHSREITYCRVPYDVEARGPDPRQRPAALAGRSPARGEMREW